MSINSAYVRKDRNTSCQKETESRDRKETVNANHYTKLLNFQQKTANLQLRVIGQKVTMTDIQTKDAKDATS